MLTIPTDPSEKGLVPRYSSLPLCCFSAQVAKEVVIFFSSAVLLAQVGQSPRCHQVRDLVGEAQKTITESKRGSQALVTYSLCVLPLLYG